MTFVAIRGEWGVEVVVGGRGGYVLLRLGYPHAKFKIFKLNFSGSDYTLPWQKISQNYFLNPLLGPF